MALDPAALEKVTKFVNEKWKRKTCALCDANSWEVKAYTYLSIMDPVPLGTIALGGNALPTIAFVCKNCGNTVLVNGRVVGVVP